MDPVRNPYAPGAGQRPPELAGRDGELAAFRVVLERVERGRPERSIVLTGLRGVGKTVLLNAMRGAAVRHGWATGKLEARPGQALRRPLAAAVHLAMRELSHPQPDAVRGVLAVLRSFAQSGPEPARGGPAKASRTRWQPGIDVPAAIGRADSGDIEIDLVELLTDVAGLAADTGHGIAMFLDELQDVGPDDVSALCAACHEISQQALPLVVVGAGLPHVPAVLSAAKSYSERLFRYARIDRLAPDAAAAALQVPALEEGAEYEPAALTAMYAATGGYPYFVQAYGKCVWDVAPRSPITESDVAMADLTERAAGPNEPDRGDLDAGVPTAAVAQALERSPQSVSPARDALLKKGLIYSGRRGRIAFTVPHFGRYLRQLE